MNRVKRAEKILFVLLVLLLPSQLGKHFWLSESYVNGLRIDYLSPTLYLTDIIIFILFLIWILESQTRLRLLGVLKKYRVLLMLSFIFVLINISIAQRTAIAAYNWLRFVQLIFLFFFLRVYIKQTSNLLQRYLPVSIIYSSIISIIQFIKQGSAANFLYWLGERRFTITTPGIAKSQILGKLILRPYATFPHPNTLAGFTLISLALLLPSYLAKKNDNKLLLLASILGFISLLLTFSLSAWIAATVLIYLAVLLKTNKNKVVVTAALLVFLTSFLFFFPPEADSISQRLIVVKRSISLIKDHPFIGVGLGNFIPSLASMQNQEPFPNLSPFLYYQPVHNIFLLLVAEVGLISLAAFIWLLSRALEIAVRKQNLAITLSLSGIILTGLLDHYWFTLHQTRLLFIIVFALAYKKIQKPTF